MPKATQPVSINGIEFDALISQEQTLTATAPEYTVEDGFPVSDNVSLDSEPLNMVLYLTNTPVTWYNRHGSSLSRVAQVEKQLKELYFAKEPVTVVTSDDVFTDMVITSVGFKKSLETGFDREIPIAFKKVRVTKARTATIPESYGRGGATGASAGTANTSAGSSGSAGGGTGTGTGTGGGSGSGGSNQNGNRKGSILYGAASSLGLL